MLISLGWIRDFVRLPDDLDARVLAEKFTRTTAEVEEVRCVSVGAQGLIAARVAHFEPPGGSDRSAAPVTLEAGGGRTFRSMTVARNIRPGDVVVFAPPGAALAARGTICAAEVSGRKSEGLILPGEELGIALAAQEAVILPPSVAPGTPLDSALFEDWIIEVDNKSLTHRPDLWGQYGIAREIAAILKLELAAYPVEVIRDWEDPSLASIPIDIREPQACRRYSGLLLDGLTTQPAPLAMQLRLGRVGLRPINALVDLTNYIMIELGQPMHAFDAAKVSRIEVEFGRAGASFTTLDGVERKLPEKALMIRSGGADVALAGVMGGRDSEVTEGTRSLLLESANFDAATIRRCATALGLRTDASARFEKSLDPLNTVTAIQRFVSLARRQFPTLRLRSRISDAFPTPFETPRIPVRTANVSRFVGRAVGREEIRDILEAIDFGCEDDGDDLVVEPPSFRATRDVSIEVDVIEEVARFIGYGNVPPALPRVSVRRFAPNALHDFEQRTLAYFAEAEGMHELHGYVWTDAARLSRLQIDPGPCVELRNAVGVGLEKLRRRLMPNLLDAIEVNRFHFSELRLMELGSVFEPASPEDAQFRHLALVLARRSKGAEDALLSELKGAVERWAWSVLTRGVAYAPTSPDGRWGDPNKCAGVRVDGADCGQIGVIPLPMRRAIDEHLSAWAVAWAEIRLDDLAELPPKVETLGTVPAFPVVELDFTFHAPRARRYPAVADDLAAFEHDLLKRITFVSSFEGASLGPDRRNLTVHTVLGDDRRTLVESDVEGFRRAFAAHLRSRGYEIPG